MPSYLGNTSLLRKHKIGLLASRKISTLSVLPTLDWATDIAQREDVAVVSGFHSRLERDVLKFFLKGRCGIIVVLARGIYKTIPEQFREAFAADRILFISNEKDTVTRTSEPTCYRRNDYVCQIADSIVFPSMNPQSSINAIYAMWANKKAIRILSLKDSYNAQK